MTIKTSSHNLRFPKTIITASIIAISLISAAALLSFELGSAGAQKTNQSSGAAKGNMTKAASGAAKGNMTKAASGAAKGNTTNMTKAASGAAKGNTTKSGGGKSNRAGITSGPGKV